MKQDPLLWVVGVVAILSVPALWAIGLSGMPTMEAAQSAHEVIPWVGTWGLIYLSMAPALMLAWVCFNWIRQH